MKVRFNSYFPKREIGRMRVFSLFLLPRVEFNAFNVWEIAIGWLFWEIRFVSEERKGL